MEDLVCVRCESEAKKVWGRGKDGGPIARSKE